MTEAKGPIFAAGFQAITKGGYPVLLLPDVNNDALQREGKPPVYHWLPNTVRLAQKENGDYKSASCISSACATMKPMSAPPAPRRSPAPWSASLPPRPRPGA